jgi:hypothetical protein
MRMLKRSPKLRSFPRKRESRAKDWVPRFRGDERVGRCTSVKE